MLGFLQNVIGAIFYSGLSIVIFFVAYRILEILIPFEFERKIAEENNTAAGIFVAGLFIALSILIATTLPH
ncbi:MAG: DUF350 domain-containing protein [Nitrospinota bacterium]|nr:MAG: DUF350 domain-containing protein [Nitrospinota bacterium]